MCFRAEKIGGAAGHFVAVLCVEGKVYTTCSQMVLSMGLAS